MRIVTGINQLGVHTNAIGRALDTTFEQMNDAELLSDLAQVPRGSTLVLHDTRTADHLQVGDLRQVSEYFVLHTIGEIGVLLLVAEIFERQYGDAFFGNRSN